MSKIKIIDVDVVPVCPYCKKDLNIINQTSKGVFENKYVFTCPYCRAILSVGLSIAG